MFFKSGKEIADEFVCRRINKNLIEKHELNKKFNCVVIDVETEGLNCSTDKIIELAFVPFSISENYKIVEVYEKYEYCSFNDPKRPISKKITELTGITDEMVAGKSLNVDLILKTLKKCDYVFAHNAKFDSGFIYSLLKCQDEFNFICSLSDIDWNDYVNKKLESLCAAHGGFFESHRALDDCYATLWLLSQEDHLQKAILGSLVKKFVIKAIGSPFASKDCLRENSYYWNAEEKCWEKIVTEENIDEEMEWLRQTVYGYIKNQSVVRELNRREVFRPNGI